MDLVIDGDPCRFELLHATYNHRCGGRAPGQHGHAHAVYHAVLVVDGEGDIIFDGEKTPARLGLLMLASPDSPHDFTPLGEGAVCYHEITFALTGRAGPVNKPFADVLSRYAGETLEPVGSTMLAQSDTRRLDGRFDALLRALRSDEPLAEFRAARLTLDLLADVAETVLLPGPALRHGDGLARSMAHLRRHFAETVSVAELAQVAGLSEGYFHRAFRRRYGETPIACQQRLRTAAARTLLLGGELACKQIAHRLGYADAFTFSKAFRRGTGQSPTAFRQKMS
jgi:AraC-like DNA-binding protein